MNNLILAAVAVLSLGVSVANAARTVAGDAQATRLQKTGAYSGE